MYYTAHCYTRMISLFVHRHCSSDISHRHFTLTLSHDHRQAGECGYYNFPWVGVHGFWFNVLRLVEFYSLSANELLEFFPPGLQTRVTSNKHFARCTSKRGGGKWLATVFMFLCLDGLVMQCKQTKTWRHLLYIYLYSFSRRWIVMLPKYIP
jgi:hypothetical protein